MSEAMAYKADEEDSWVGGQQEAWAAPLPSGKSKVGG